MFFSPGPISDSEYLGTPENILHLEEDLFGSTLESSATLTELRKEPTDMDVFAVMVSECLKSIVDALERQYAKYFTLDVTELLREETKSARMHNIDSEEIMGMFSAAQKKAPSATMCYLPSQLRIRKLSGPKFTLIEINTDFNFVS